MDDADIGVRAKAQFKSVPPPHHRLPGQSRYQLSLIRLVLAARYRQAGFERRSRSVHYLQPPSRL
jgi:hypothetical protein